MLRTLLLAMLFGLGHAQAEPAIYHPLTHDKLSRNQVFRYDIGAEPPSIDPQLVEDVSGNEIANDLFETLVLLDAEGNVTAGAASHWESNANKDIYTFHLRKNARWSNGVAVTAQDFPIIPISHYSSAILLKSDIKGWPFHNIQNIWYSKNLYRSAP